MFQKFYPVEEAGHPATAKHALRIFGTLRFVSWHSRGIEWLQLPFAQQVSTMSLLESVEH